MRRSHSEDVTVLVAKLRNDNEGRYTEDIFQWLKQQGKKYNEWGRSWNTENRDEGYVENLNKALNRTQSLALLEGYVGADGAIVRIWAKGGKVSEEINFSGGEHELEKLENALEMMMSEGMTYEAWLHRARIGDDHEYGRLLERVQQTRRQMTIEKWQNEADFIRAYVENIRADKKGEKEAQQATLGIYKRLLAEVGEEDDRMRILVNLGIAELRTAKQEGSTDAAMMAIRRWQEAEQISASRGKIDEWARVRNFQTEAELLIDEIYGDYKGVISALKRQIETLEDTQLLLTETTALEVNTWLVKADTSEEQITGSIWMYMEKKGERKIWQTSI